MKKQEAIKEAFEKAREIFESSDEEISFTAIPYDTKIAIRMDKYTHEFCFEPEHEPCPLCGGMETLRPIEHCPSFRISCKCGYMCMAPSGGGLLKDEQIRSAWLQHDMLCKRMQKAGMTYEFPF